MSRKYEPASVPQHISVEWFPKRQLLVSRRVRGHPLLAQRCHLAASVDRHLPRGCAGAAAPAGGELVDPVAASAEDPAVAEEGEEVESIADRTAGASDGAPAGDKQVDPVAASAVGKGGRGDDVSPTSTADFAHDPDGPLQNRPAQRG